MNERVSKLEDEMRILSNMLHTHLEESGYIHADLSWIKKALSVQFTIYGSCIVAVVAYVLHKL